MARRPLCRVLVVAALTVPATTASPVSAVAATPASGWAAVTHSASSTSGARAATPGVPGRPAAPVSPVADDAAPQLTLASVTPAILTGNADLTVTGTYRNTGSTPVTRPVLRIVAAQSSRVMTRAEVRAWAGRTEPAQGTEVGRTTIGTTLAPGAAAPFRLVVRGLADHDRSATYGAVPISVESGTTSVRTFAGFQRLKQYQPIAISWAVPLTLDADPALFGAEGAPREAAWANALGAGSRIGRVLDATDSAPVTWALDPSLTPSLLTEPVDTGDENAQERMVRAAVEQRITGGAARHTPWVLPDTDADVGAIAGDGSAQDVVRGLVDRAAAVATRLDGRADVAWPADGGYTSTTEAGLRSLFRSPALAGQVVSSSVVPVADDGSTPAATQRSRTGLGLLASDDSLSTLLAGTSTPGQALLSAQQFVAESAALLNELPGTQGRTVFVTAPRGFDPDPVGASTFFATAASIPWLATTSTDAQLTAARRAVPLTAAPVTRPSTTVPATARPVLTARRAATLETTLRTVRGVALIRDDPGNDFARTWGRATEQLASARWRANPTGWNTLNARVEAASSETTTALRVAAGTINFLAESGRLQITVLNDLPVAVKDVKLAVAASNPRLRIDSQPPSLRIGARSRATVNVSVTALAAGPVPLRTTLTTPDGTVIGQGADVQVRVTPTGDWVYWGLGGLGGVILLVGLVRSFGRRKATTR